MEDDVEKHDTLGGNILSLDSFLANPSLSPEEKEALKRADEIFKTNVTSDTNVSLQAYYYGVTVGYYTSKIDPDIVDFMAKESRNHHNSQIRKLPPGAKYPQRWHPQAEKLANEARKTNPRYGKEAIVGFIEDNWQIAQEGIECPSGSTLMGFLRYIESNGRLSLKKVAD